eukprot:23922_1
MSDKKKNFLGLSHTEASTLRDGLAHYIICATSTTPFYRASNILKQHSILRPYLPTNFDTTSVPSSPTFGSLFYNYIYGTAITIAHFGGTGIPAECITKATTKTAHTAIKKPMNYWRIRFKNILRSALWDTAGHIMYSSFTYHRTVNQTLELFGKKPLPGWFRWIYPNDIYQAGFGTNCMIYFIRKFATLMLHDIVEPIVTVSTTQKQYCFLTYMITVVAGLLVYPFDTIMKRQILLNDTNWLSFKNTVQQYGLRSLWDGCLWHIFGDVVNFSASYFFKFYLMANGHYQGGFRSLFNDAYRGFTGKDLIQRDYHEEIVKQMVALEFGTYQECVDAARKTKENWNINCVVKTLNSMRINYQQTNDNDNHYEFEKKNIFKVDTPLNVCLSIQTCSSIKKLISALTYYSSLNLDTQNDQDKLFKYCTKTHQSFLNDSIHMIRNHNQDIHQICDMLHRQLTKCDMKNCLLLQRHYRNRRHDHTKTVVTHVQDTNVLFYRDIMDTLHCYLCHLYDLGLRVKMSDNIQVMVDTLNEADCFDAHFDNMHTVISAKQNEVKQMKGIDQNTVNNSKFIINDKQSSNETFLDRLFQFMMNAGIEKTNLNQLKSIINEDEHDSDSLKNVFEQEYEIIVDFIPCEYYQPIKQYLRSCKISASSFSIGYIFYYWDIYQSKNISNEKQRVGNKNDHSGYQPYELFIKAKYESIKDEMLHNEILPLEIVELQKSTYKALEYEHADVVRQIKSDEKTEMTHHYGIKANTPLSFKHILSIILYCDWTELCKVFSSTFRESKPHETISSVKKRNSEFAIWSKTLRETIEYFGQQGYKPDKDDKWNIEHDLIKGPFFCGMSCVMTMTQCNIRLCGPTSTSRDKEVAIRFGGSDGMILRLNNNGYYMSECLRSFNCSWLSTYAGESESLFIGGYYQMKLETIIIVDGSRNYGTLFKPLWYFDCMISGTDMKTAKMNITEKHFKLLGKLINHKLDIVQNSCDSYMNDTFLAFTNSKTEVIFNLHHMNVYFKKLNELVMHPLAKYKVNMEQERKKEHQNLFREIAVKLFKNVTKITVFTTDLRGNLEYPLTESGLLCLIEALERDNLQINIKAARQYDAKETLSDRSVPVDYSWIHKLWDKCSWSLRQKFRKQKYIINYSEQYDGISELRLHQDCLTICKNLK